jgi:hypothetical protein
VDVLNSSASTQMTVISSLLFIPASQLCLVTGYLDAQPPLPIRVPATRLVVVPAHGQ